MLLLLLKSAYVTQSGFFFLILIFNFNSQSCCFEPFPQGKEIVQHKMLKIKHHIKQSRVKIKFHFVMVKASHNNLTTM